MGVVAALNPQRFLKIAYKDSNYDTYKSVADDSKRLAANLTGIASAAASGKVKRIDLLRASEIVTRSMRKVQQVLAKMKKRGEDKRTFKSYNVLQSSVVTMDRSIKIALKVLKDMKSFEKLFGSTPPEYISDIAKQDVVDITEYEEQLPRLELTLVKLQELMRSVRSYPKKVPYEKLKGMLQKLSTALKTIVDKMDMDNLREEKPILVDAFTNMYVTATNELATLSRVTPRKF